MSEDDVYFYIDPFDEIKGLTYEQIGENLPPLYVLPVPLAAIDAAVWSFNQDAYGTDKSLLIEREQITLGSVHYIFRNAPPYYNRIIVIQLRSIASEVVEISIDWPEEDIQPSSSDESLQSLRGVIIANHYICLDSVCKDKKCAAFAIQVAATQQYLYPLNATVLYTHAFNTRGSTHMVAKARNNTIHDPSAAIKMARDELAKQGKNRRRGAPADPINEWARAELKLGRDYQEVFVGYLRQREIDITDQRAVARERTRFKKAVTPRAQPKKKVDTN